MQWTTRAPLYPSKCAITGLSNGEPMIDTGNHIVAPAYGDGVHVYLSRAGVEKAAVLCDMVPLAKYEEQAEKLREAEAKLAEFAELEEYVEGIKFLETKGFKPRQRAPRSDRGVKKTNPRKESQPA